MKGGQNGPNSPKISIFTQFNGVKCLFPRIDFDTAFVPPPGLYSNVDKVLGIKNCDFWPFSGSKITEMGTNECNWMEVCLKTK